MTSDAEALQSRPDTPRNAMSLLGRNVTLAVAGVLVGLAGVAWWSTVRQANSMSDVVSGLGQVGARAPNDMAIPVFLGMWVAMMVAMMFPTVAPIVLAHRMVVRKRGEGNTPTVAFIVGYLVVWSLIGVIPMAGFLGFRNLAADAADSRWLPTVAGAILIGAGVYQFTRWKATCLKACRSPMGFLMTHDFGGGSRSAFKAGISHGAYCLGCCWALMAVLVVVGLMNLVWMAGIALIFLAEKNWKHGVGLTKLIGSGLVALGIAVIISPGILPNISGATGQAMDKTGHNMGKMMGG